MSVQRNVRVSASFSSIGLAAALLAQGAAAETIRHGTSAWTKGAEAVHVTGETLVHTAQVLGADADGRFVDGDAAAQTTRVLDNLQAVLATAGSQLSAVVKLNLYVRPGGFVEPVLAAVQNRFPRETAPAISVVETALPHTQAIVGADAVATTARPQGSRVALGANYASLAPGPRVYISGQAVREDDLKRATVGTLELLRGNLELVGLTLSDTVQLKAFLKPMTSAATVAAAIEEFFGGAAPPLVFVEWSNADPIEIELIAAGRESSAASSEPVRYVRAPNETASPVFCRIVQVDHPTSIYFSMIAGRGADGPAQIRDAFERLQSAVGRAGGDLRHLVKATYYVTTDDVSAPLLEIRKGLYDPSRPPAASKATVQGTGIADNMFTMDMIAVPVAQRK